MDHWQRVAVYLSGCVVIGLAIVIFSHNFFEFANAGGSQGYLTLFGFGLVFLNLGFAVNRRFMLKSDRSPVINYTLSFLLVAPTLLWVFTKDEGLGDSLITFVLTLLFSAFLGGFFGMRRGRAKRHDYLRKVYENEDEDMPEELKRPHDNLSKN
jgi:drug/metabolite transporter (DMT)-like permease